MSEANSDDISPDLVMKTLDVHSGKLMQLPGVVAVGQGECNNTPCIKVFATQSTSALLKQLPKQLNGIQIILETSDEIKAR
ncbi:hypothetical protein [Litoribacillus peritrichatus]|uniref:Uncharacterized protein n=1 Tax=Litoribacillus peritrichatus TaxID=718191 RepID=A0ABP7N5R8_9GAMM